MIGYVSLGIQTSSGAVEPVVCALASLFRGLAREEVIERQRPRPFWSANDCCCVVTSFPCPTKPRCCACVRIIAPRGLDLRRPFTR